MTGGSERCSRKIWGHCDNVISRFGQRAVSSDEQSMTHGGGKSILLNSVAPVLSPGGRLRPLSISDPLRDP